MFLFVHADETENDREAYRAEQIGRPIGRRNRQAAPGGQGQYPDCLLAQRSFSAHHVYFLLSHAPECFTRTNDLALSERATAKSSRQSIVLTRAIDFALKSRLVVCPIASLA